MKRGNKEENPFWVMYMAKTTSQTETAEEMEEEAGALGKKATDSLRSVQQVAHWRCQRGERKKERRKEGKAARQKTEEDELESLFARGNSPTTYVMSERPTIA